MVPDVHPATCLGRGSSQNSCCILRGWEIASNLEGAGAGSEGFNSADAQACLPGEGAGLETRVWDI